MLRLYNTLSRQEEPFEPAHGNTVRMYACGPTVYARAHIGNFRTYVCVDVLRRTLKHLCGYTMHEAINYTDVDDKTIAGAQAAGVPLREYTEPWIPAFREDTEQLGIEPPEETPRATDEANLRAMGDMILALERNGHTYRRDGSIYFKISTLPQYGKLARLDHEGMKPGVSVDVDEYSKDDARDFVLWKASKPGEPSWDVGAGPGRPGWHLECSAMALRLLGEPPIDIHAGGIDLIFPHHENEIAQSEGATKQPFSRFWFHIEHLFVENEKMSKSLGNVYTLPEVLARGYRRVGAALPAAVVALPQAAQFHLGGDGAGRGIAAADRRLPRAARVGVRRRESSPPRSDRSRTRGRRLPTALQDDLNTAAGLAAIFDLVRDINAAIDAKQIGRDDADAARRAIDDFDCVLGVVTLRRAEDAQPPVPVDEIERLIEERKAARGRRDFAAADGIRNALAERGILLEDNPGGTRWKRK